jgi:tetratricopeptide (TPR) repeat protein
MERCYGLVASLLIAVWVVGLVAATGMANPQERIDYWRQHYPELQASEDARVTRAQRIFQRLLLAAGKRPGVVPRLLLIAEEPLNVVLPIALPDGGIIVSKRTLDMCYQDPVYGDDRLAFVLAHELAHQIKEDFWHMRFFHALTASTVHNAQDHVIQEGRALASATDYILAKELQADEQGIVYASLAGFHTQAIVSADERSNFFAEWVQRLEPSRPGGLPRSTSHPTPEQRATVVKSRLRQILDQVQLFQAGLWFYQVGQYPRAIRAFETFLPFFPSREVYHNLAASHHQLALQYYSVWQPAAPPLPLQLSVVADATTQARQIALRGRSPSPAELFHEHLDKAIEFYHMAISLDPSYAPALNNLGCALLFKGDLYKAVTMLQDALKLAPDSLPTLNNIGVAFFALKEVSQAKMHLARAHQLSPTYAAPLFNLGRIAQMDKQTSEARRYWLAYLQQDSASSWAGMIRQHLEMAVPAAPLVPLALPATEQVLGVAIAAFADDIPRHWGKPRTSVDMVLEAEPLTVAHYTNGIMVLTQEKEVLLLGALQDYAGTSSQGIAIGSSADQVLGQYGNPARTVVLTQGESWIYDPPGIAFQLRDGKVVSWLLF